jgi:tetratricopeptide (TPR) repeat protein
MVLENKDWEQAAILPIPSVALSWEQYPWEKSILHFTRALGSAHLGNIISAEKELATLQSLHEDLVKLEDDYKADQVMIQVKATQAWIEFARGNHEKALQFMRESAILEDNTQKHPVTPGEVIPARELLGDLLLAAGKPHEALEAYEMNLKKSPNRFNGLYGAAVAAKALGDTQKSKQYFELLLNITEASSSDRPEVEEAEAYIQQNVG